MPGKFSLLILIGVSALLAGFLLAACSSSDSTLDDPGGDFDPNGDGDSITDPDGDDDGGIIIPPTDGDGEEEQEVECLADRDCPGDEYCDMQNNICRRRKNTCEPCETSRECGTGEDLCLPDGVCGRYCDANWPCSDGYTCETYPDLGGSQQCTFNAGLTDGELNSPCCANVHCNEPYVCYTLTSRCMEGCVVGASSCPKGSICYDDPDDGRNPYCTEGCLINGDCKTGEICFENSCYEGDCSNKYDCPIEYLCKTDDLSFTCYSGCEDDGDCRARNECIGGQCVERVGCEGTWQCRLAQMCTEEFPLSDPPEPEDRGCCFNPKEEETTVGDETCVNPYDPEKFCDACTDTQNETQECGADDACVELIKEDENGNEVSLGYFCLIRWDCSFRSEDGLDQGTVNCPRGYTCVKIEDGQLAGKYCLADCTDPIFSEM